MNGNQRSLDTDAPQRDPLQVIDQLVSAINSHDLDALTACFADGYVNVTPAHPARGFTGKPQVRQNWDSIFEAIPDIEASVVRSAVDGRVIWTEWEHRGTHCDGAPHLLRGVVIFSVGADTITGTRFFLEPVDESGPGAAAALSQLLDS